MFSQKPTPQPEPNGLKLELRISEATLIKLLPLGITLLLSSGLWIYVQPFSPDSTSAPAVAETAPTLQSHND